MITSQPTTSPLDTTRTVAPHEQTEAALPSPDDQTAEQHGFKSGTTETIVQPERAHRPFAYPAWPTSKPGPQATSPLPGQHPHPLRADQMVYECYDQERGRPCAPPRLAV